MSEELPQDQSCAARVYLWNSRVVQALDQIWVFQTDPLLGSSDIFLECLKALEALLFYEYLLKGYIALQDDYLSKRRIEFFKELVVLLA